MPCSTAVAQSGAIWEGIWHVRHGGRCYFDLWFSCWGLRWLYVAGPDFSRAPRSVRSVPAIALALARRTKPEGAAAAIVRGHDVAYDDRVFVLSLGWPSGALPAKGCASMFDRLVDAVLIFGFPLGVLVGYMWRDRISRARRARYLAERNRAARGDTALSCSDPVKPSMFSPRPRWAIL